MKSFVSLVICCTCLGAGLPARAADPVRILAVFSKLRTPLTQYIPSEEVRGVDLAVEVINGRGGLLGRPIEMASISFQSSLEARADLAKALERWSILAVIGANTSDPSLAIAPILQEAGIPMISPISTNPDVTRVGSYIFRACFTDDYQGKAVAWFSLRRLGAKSAVILRNVGSSYSRGLAEQFKSAFREGGSVLWEGSYLAEDIDFTDLLTKAGALKPDVVFVPGHGTSVGRLLTQAHHLGIRTAFLGGDGWGKGTLAVAGDEAAEGHYFANHWHKDVPTAESRDFVAAYQRRYGEQAIAAGAPLAYDAMLLLENAVARAGSLDRVAIRDALAATRGFQGITGTYTFDENGDPVNKQAVILSYHRGEIVFADSLER